MIRRLLIALALIAGLTPAIAQVPPPVPALPDTERRTTYAITGTTCACAVNFALYGDSTDYQNWVEVFINGVRVNYNDGSFGWTITSPTGSLSAIPRPVTDAVLTFNSVQTGTIQIVGAVRPRRTSTFAENRGVAARDLNQVLNYIVASLREVWDKINDVTGRGLFSQPGNTVGPLPLPAACVNSYLAFDSSGLNPVCQTATPAQITVTGVTGAFNVLGRLTLAASTPVMNATSCAGAQCAAQTILYFAPDGSSFIPVFDGTTQNLKQFTSTPTDTVGLSLNLAASANWAANSCFDVFYANVASVYYFGTGPAWSTCAGGSASRGYSLGKLNGVPVNAAVMTLRDTAAHTISVPANQATYLGTVVTDSVAGKISYKLGSSAAGGGGSTLNVWNYWNRKSISTNVTDSTLTWTSNVFPNSKNCDNSTTFRHTFVSGLGDDDMLVTMHGTAGAVTAPDASGWTAYMGINLDASVDGTANNLDFYGSVTSYSVVYAPHGFDVTGRYGNLIGQHFIQCGAGGENTQMKWTNVGATGQLAHSFILNWRN